MIQTIFEQNFFCDFASIKAISENIKAVMQSKVADGDWVGKFELAIVESINNIVEHSYADSMKGYLAIKVVDKPDVIEIELADNGKGMDILSCLKGPPEPEDLPEGGWGLFIIESFVDDISYSIENGINYLLLTKNKPKNKK